VCVDKRLADIQAEVARNERYFDMYKQVQAMGEGWAELKKKVEALPVDADFAQNAFAAHAPEYGRLCAFMRDLGDASGMARRPAPAGEGCAQPRRVCGVARQSEASG
jgi:hypothetical protein